MSQYNIQNLRRYLVSYHNIDIIWIYSPALLDECPLYPLPLMTRARCQCFFFLHLHFYFMSKQYSSQLCPPVKKQVCLVTWGG